MRRLIVCYTHAWRKSSDKSVFFFVLALRLILLPLDEIGSARDIAYYSSQYNVVINLIYAAFVPVFSAAPSVWWDHISDLLADVLSCIFGSHWRNDHNTSIKRATRIWILYTQCKNQWNFGKISIVALQLETSIKPYRYNEQFNKLYKTYTKAREKNNRRHYCSPSRHIHTHERDAINVYPNDTRARVLTLIFCVNARETEEEHIAAMFAYMLLLLLYVRKFSSYIVYIYIKRLSSDAIKSPYYNILRQLNGVALSHTLPMLNISFVDK